jgi:hypothetical protein
MMRKLSQANEADEGQEEVAVGTEFALMDVLLKADPAIRHRKNRCNRHKRAG